MRCIRLAQRHIRNILGGVIFREPIICQNVPRLVPGWTKPIIIGRHAFATIPRDRLQVPGKGKLTLTFWVMTAPRSSARYPIPGSGVAMAMYNLDDSIRDFARASLNYGSIVAIRSIFDQNTSSRSTTAASRTSSGDLRQGVKDAFEKKKITYEHRLIDDMVAAALKWSGGYAGPARLRRRRTVGHRGARLRSLGLMTSVLMTPDGKVVEAEAPTDVTGGTIASTEGRADLDQLGGVDLCLDARVAHRAKLATIPISPSSRRPWRRSPWTPFEAGDMTKDLALW